MLWPWRPRHKVLAVALRATVRHGAFSFLAGSPRNDVHEFVAIDAHVRREASRPAAGASPRDSGLVVASGTEKISQGTHGRRSLAHLTRIMMLYACIRARVHPFIRSFLKLQRGRHTHQASIRSRQRHGRRRQGTLRRGSCFAIRNHQRSGVIRHGA